ncbi:histone deacetylase complex subunit SAP25 [Pyxicephalus adspersus]|uniref:histone deacetylase complex subunit SAP25 n=1 Tax=Pyxicephalus adspersus TaxID=30357 RepID=UPI003B5C10A0
MNTVCRSGYHLARWFCPGTDARGRSILCAGYNRMRGEHSAASRWRCCLLMKMLAWQEEEYCSSEEEEEEEEEEELIISETFRSSYELETFIGHGTPGHARPSVSTSSGPLIPAGHPVSYHTRTLCHPSFEAYYNAVATLQNRETQQMQIQRERGFFINSAEYFYTDPLLPPGHRVYNCLSPASNNVFENFGLVTPPPIMSSGIFVTSSQSSSSVSRSPGTPQVWTPESCAFQQVCTPGSGRSLPVLTAVNESLCNSGTGRSLPEPGCSAEWGRSFPEWECSVDSGKNLPESLFSIESGRSLSQSVCSAESGRSLSQSVCSAESGRSLCEPVFSIESGRSLSEPVCSAESGRSLPESVCTPSVLFGDDLYTHSEIEAASGLLNLCCSYPPSGIQ